MKNTNITKTIEDSIKKEVLSLNIINVLVALSGGPDSITTIYILKKLGLTITALHCNFHLRGEESNRDMDFVKEFCFSQEIPLQIKEFNIKEFRQNNKGNSTEMICRKLRYKWFEEKLKKMSYDRIVTGHNADDNIETFFLNMLRGSGTRGLKGIQKDNGVIWRPLLNYHRNEILEFIKENNLEYITDSTNFTNDFRRNYLRNEIIPLLRKEWKGFDSSMDKTIQNIENENKIIEESLKKEISCGKHSLSVTSILNYPAPILLIKRFIDPLNPFTKTPEEVLASIRANKPHIRVWNLRKGTLYLQNGNLFIKMIHSERCS